MKKHSPVRPHKLRASSKAESIPYASSCEIPDQMPKTHPQKRMMEALKLGLHIKAQGYNIFLVGEANLGRRYMLKDYLLPRAEKEKTPPDLAYVYNFSKADAPKLLSLPPGTGQKLKENLSQAIKKIQKEILIGLDTESYISEKSSLLKNLQDEKNKIMDSMNKMALKQGFSLSMDDNGEMVLSPMAYGKVLKEGEFDKLASEEKNKLNAKGDKLVEPINKLVRQLMQSEQAYMENEQSLEKELLKKIISQKLDPLIIETKNSVPNDDLNSYLDDLRKDIIDNHTAFINAGLSEQSSQIQNMGRNFNQVFNQALNQSLNMGQSPAQGAANPESNSEDIEEKYSINLFVDNGSTKGAPIVFEEHPTIAKLMGSIEREAEMGALIPHFSLIKAGSLHRANGGYLVIHAEDLLRYSGAWEALMRSLRAGSSRIDDAEEDDSARAKGLEPEAVPLSLKVILVGDEELYEYMLGDERFSKLFKIKAHMTEYVSRDKAAINTYLAYIKRIIKADNLLPFKRDALAGLLDFGSRLIEDQSRMSLMFPGIREIMVESSAMASLEKGKEVNADILEKTLKARAFRSNLLEESFMEEYDRRIIKVVTEGKAVGRVNGLALTMYGDFEFGLPHQISCTVGAGSGGIIDLERDAELGGPIHTKAMMILKSYLVGTFAHNKPLILTGSLGFEQSYMGIEGDSASGAELAALLSALANIPIDQSFAFTGAVGQSGEIMAVGGVTRKIEGYFQVCKRHGLTGKQGIIMPKDNLKHLMLNNGVVEEIEKGNFHIYAVEHISDAMEILTGLKAGTLRKDGKYTKDSLYALVDERLLYLTQISSKYKKF